MNDHDLLITIKADVGHLSTEVIGLRTDTHKRLEVVENKLEEYGKLKVQRDDELRRIKDESVERFQMNSNRITALETNAQAGVTRTESNRSYIFRKIFEWVMPALFVLIGIILAKLGILNLK